MPKIPAKIADDVKPAPAPASAPALGEHFDSMGELEAKLSFLKGLGYSVKALWPGSRHIPKLMFTSLLQLEPAFLGLSYTFDHTLPQKTDNAELMLGLKPCNNFYTYLLQ